MELRGEHEVLGRGEVLEQRADGERRGADACQQSGRVEAVGLPAERPA
jgi:hypothetical protein